MNALAPSKWPIRRRILVLPCLFAAGFVLLHLANVILEKKMFREVIFPNYERQLIAGHQRALKALVDVEAVALGEQVRPLGTEAEKIAAIIVATDPIRFFDNSSGYFFTYQLDGVRINVPVNKADNGKNLLGLEDANGVKIVQSFIRQAKAGGGFTEYKYNKPGKGIQPKLSYSRLIPGTDILVGTGVYTDDVQEERLAWESLIKKSNAQFMIYKLAACGLLLLAVVLASIFTVRSIKRMEEQLTYITKAVESTSDAVGISDAQGRHFYQNQAFTELFGYTTAEALQTAGGGAATVKNPAVARELFEKIMSGKSWAGELELVAKNGRVFPGYERADAIIDNEGKIIGLVGIVTDITDRRQAEETLRKSERKFAKMFHASPLPMSLSTIEDGRYLDTNEEMLKLLQRSHEDVIGHTALELNVWPDVEKRAAIVAQFKCLGSLRNVELELCGRSGQIRHVLWSAEEVDINGERCWLGSALDITERKQKEQSYALLATAVEQAAESIVITNLQGAILYANPAFEQNTGYTRAEVLGNNPRLLKSGQQDEEFYHHLWSAIGRGETWHGHFINQRKDGTKFEEDATISPVRDAAGNIVNFVAVKRDVTHEMQLEGRIRQTQKMEAIGTLAGGIAHDFNNVLSAIFGYGYLLQQDTEGNAAAQEELAEILKAANRAKDLVQQILTFSRQREQKRQIVRLDSVVKEATKLLRASLPAQIKIEVMLADEAPAVLADPTQIYQVTMNLATNALHAMEGRSGQLTVRLDTFQPEAEFLSVHPEFKRIEYARLTVADTGHGMDAKTMARIFEPFFTTKPVGKGTGLGLAVVHGIVQSHDGLLTVASQIGQGTTFQLYFPAQTSSAELPDAAAGETAIGQGQHILLLDDEPALTASLRRLLEGLNYQVTTSNSAGEAMALFNANPAQFDLVITDMTMPEMNGLEVARQFHTRRPELPVLLASGLAANLTSENLRAAGICELLQKPVAITLLAEALHRTLAKS